MIVKPKFTGRDIQISYLIFDETFDAIPYIQSKINTIQETLKSDDIWFDSEEMTVIKDCIMNRELPNYNYKPEEITAITREIDRAETEAILNIP